MNMLSKLLLSTLVSLALANSTNAGEDSTGRSQNIALDAKSAVFFGLIDEGKVEVKLTPKAKRGSESIDFAIANLTRSTQTIELPPSLVATPLLAQQQPANPQPQNLGFGLRTGQFPHASMLAALDDKDSRIQSAATTPLRLTQLLEKRLYAAGLPGIKRGSQPPKFPSVFDQEPFLPNGTLRLADGESVNIALPTVCLQYGNPDPHPRYEYELKPLVEVIDSLALRRALWLNAQGRFNQAMTQAVAWHEANNLSWRELSEVADTVDGRRVPLFTKAELMVARRLVALPERSQAKVGQKSSVGYLGAR